MERTHRFAGVVPQFILAATIFTVSLAMAFPVAVAGRSSPRVAAPLDIAEQGNFFVGGQYSADDEIVGQMYVEYQIPEHRTHRYPIIFVHGGGQIGTGWWRTPDGREGWAQYFLRRGYAVYVVDQPARGRSAYNSDLGPINDPFNVLAAQQLWAAPERFNLWPAASFHANGWAGPPREMTPLTSS